MWLQDRRLRPRAFGLGLIGVIVFTLACMMVDWFGRTRPAVPHAPVIVVLGARVLPGGLPSGALRARIEEGIAQYQAGRAPLLLFSGGVGDHPPSEAAVGRQLALAAGVPEEACLVEEESHSTWDNARFTARILRERGINELILVTDPYHLLRARQYFWAEGLTVQPAPARMTDRNLRMVDRVWWTAREVLALMSRPRLLLVRRPNPEPDERRRR